MLFVAIKYLATHCLYTSTRCLHTSSPHESAQWNVKCLYVGSFILQIVFFLCFVFWFIINRSVSQTQTINNETHCFSLWQSAANKNVRIYRVVYSPPFLPIEFNWLPFENLIIHNFSNRGQIEKCSKRWLSNCHLIDAPHNFHSIWIICITRWKLIFTTIQTDDDLATVFLCTIWIVFFLIFSSKKKATGTSHWSHGIIKINQPTHWLSPIDFVVSHSHAGQFVGALVDRH